MELIHGWCDYNTLENSGHDLFKFMKHLPLPGIYHTETDSDVIEYIYKDTAAFLTVPNCNNPDIHQQ